MRVSCSFDYTDLLNHLRRSVNDLFALGGDGRVARRLAGLSHNGGSHVWTCERAFVK